MIRSGERIVRWGGVEFLIILTGVSLEDARSVGERVLDQPREICQEKP
ncbi:MAG: GGDEF domain-containing protein [Thermotogae bacterium]|nr:GGDEF domain-containing protein [Mesotoga sp.]MCP5456975.1 GGDEF domain-containing protein [Thermotogota bacterium]MCP5460192.1 GGDEF domain-containing protein [Thermotogota bacterium]